MEKNLEQLQKLREEFDKAHISKLPKPTINRDDYKKLPRQHCDICGGYHAATNTIHLDYVGHAALTNRLLDVDPLWSWEPMAVDEHGLPVYDSNGGLWIKLTVCGLTRLGYGHAGDKKGGDAIKEVIGDALRNAAMRFGAALELWHKGDLKSEDNDESNKYLSNEQINIIKDLAIKASITEKMICEFCKVSSLDEIESDKFAGIVQKLNLTIENKSKNTKTPEQQSFVNSINAVNDMLENTGRLT